MTAFRGGVHSSIEQSFLSLHGFILFVKKPWKGLRADAARPLAVLRALGPVALGCAAKRGGRDFRRAKLEQRIAAQAQP